MTRHFSVIAILALGLCGSSSAIQRKEFSGRSAASLAPVYQNDGDTVEGFSVSCSSTAWTPIVVARPARRRVHIQVIDSNTAGVCVSTHTTAGIACDDTTVGVELSTGAANRSMIELFFEGQLNGRARAGSSGERLKGYESYDSGD